MSSLRSRSGGRKMRDDRQPVVKVLAESAFPDRALQVAIGGRDHAHIHLHIAHATHAADDLVFEHAQQFGLQQRRQFADFVEEERAAVGHFEQALLHGLGVGEGAALVAEEFGFHQGLGNGRAVDGDKRLVLPAALVMDGFGDEVFAGAALALYQDGGGFAGRDLADEAQQLGHLWRNANDVVIAGAASHLAAQRLDFGAQASGLERVLDGDLRARRNRAACRRSRRRPA